MWIEVLRSNIVVHRLIIVHWCIPLTDMRSPTDNENGNQGTEHNIKSVNRCVEFELLKESIDQGTLMYSKNYWWWENLPLMTISLKAIKWFSTPIPDQWSKVNGIESSRRRELRHSPSSNMRYSAALYNVEGLEKYVHEPVIVSGMADMQSKDNWGMADWGFEFLWKRA